MYYTYVRNRKKYKGRECMDFANRNSQTTVPRPAGEGSAPASGKKGKKPSMARVALVALLFLGTALVVALVLWISTTNSSSSSSKFVNDKQLQAVFLNNGQVYFGNIVAKNSNSKYIDLKNIYYLRTDTSSTATTTTAAANNISLVKLGCELHGPTDEMIINVQQLTFWENLKSDGQVAKAIATYKQQNPNGQSCNTTTGSQTTPAATTPTNNSGTTTTKP
jgi:hypothetical protein